MQGYFNYHAVPGNLVSLRSFRLQVIRRWFRALRRRSQRSRMTWARIEALANRWLSFPKIPHPYPTLRFDAKHLRVEPHAAIRYVRIRAGGARSTGVPTATEKQIPQVVVNVANSKHRIERLEWLGVFRKQVLSQLT